MKKPPAFKIKARKPDDSVQIQGDADKTVFVIKSPTGISHIQYFQKIH